VDRHSIAPSIPNPGYEPTSKHPIRHKNRLEDTLEVLEEALTRRGLAIKQLLGVGETMPSDAGNGRDTSLSASLGAEEARPARGRVSRRRGSAN
jgi:hypothetical protein